MKNKNILWGVLIAFIALLLAACILPPLPDSKPHPSRISLVNRVASVSRMLPPTNALPAALPTN